MAVRMQKLKKFTDKLVILMDKKMTFQENMTELGKIVSQLEKGDIPLEQAVELYGEGVRLSALCKKQLNDAKIKITEVDGDQPSEK